MHLRARTVDLSDNMGHAGLVSEEGCQMNWFRLVILGERLALSTLTHAALLRQEAERPVTGRRKLTMRLKCMTISFNKHCCSIIIF